MTSASLANVLSLFFSFC